MNLNKLGKKHLILLYFLVLLETVLFLIAFGGVHMSNDTPTYYDAFNELLKGKIHIWRTPVYPFVLGISSSLFGSLGSYIVVLFQTFLFILSLSYFGKLCDLLGVANKTKVVLTFLYGLNPTAIFWNISILTESLSATLLLLFVYNFIRLLKGFSYNRVLGNCLLILALVFIRPSFIYIPFILLSFSLFYLRNIKTFISLVIIGFIAIISLTFYSLEFKKEYGVLTPSAISLVNQYVNLRHEGLLSYGYTDNLDLKREVSNYVTIHADCPSNEIACDEVCVLIEKYGAKDVNEIVKYSIESNRILYVKGILYRFYKTASSPFLSAPLFMYALCCLFMPIGFLYVFLILFSFLLLANYFKKNKAILNTFVLIIVIAQIFIVIVGAFDSIGRLFYPIVPLVLILVSQALKYLEVKEASLS